MYLLKRKLLNSILQNNANFSIDGSLDSLGNYPPPPSSLLTFIRGRGILWEWREGGGKFDKENKSVNIPNLMQFREGRLRGEKTERGREGKREINRLGERQREIKRKKVEIWILLKQKQKLFNKEKLMKKKIKYILFYFNTWI